MNNLLAFTLVLLLPLGARAQLELPEPYASQYHLADYLLSQGKLTEAYKQAKTLHHTVQDNFGGRDLKSAETALLLGLAAQASRKFGESESLFRNVLLIRDTLNGKVDEKTFWACSTLGASLASQGKHEEGSYYIETAIKGLEGLGKTGSIAYAIAYQSLAAQYYYRNLKEQSAATAYKALKLFENLNEKRWDSHLASLHSLLGLLYSHLSEFESALDHLKKSEFIYQSLGQGQNEWLTLFYLNAGATSGNMGFYNESIRYGELAVERLYALNPDTSLLAIPYSNLGNMYKEIGDYTKAAYYLESAIQFHNNRLAAQYNNLGLAYLEGGEYEKAVEYFNKSIVEHQQFGANTTLEDQARPHNNLSIYFMVKKEYSKALEEAEKALELRRKRWGWQHVDVGRSHIGIANIYKEQEQLNLALSHFDSAIFIQRSLAHKGLYPELGQAYLAKSQILERQSNFEYASMLIDSALKASGFETEYAHSLGVLDALYQKAKLLENQYNKSNDLSLIAEAQLWYSKAVEFSDGIRMKIGSEISKAQLIHRYHAIYEGAIELELSLAEKLDQPVPDKILDYFEKNKSMALQDAMQQSGALSYKNLPAEVLNKEAGLRQKITHFEVQLQQSANNENTILKQELFKSKIEYEALQKRLEIDYPDYYNLKYQQKTIPLAAIQMKLLKHDQSLLNYFVGDSTIYILVIRQDFWKVVRVKKDFPLEDWVNYVVKGIGDVDLMGQEHKLLNYIAAAQSLYQKLIFPVSEYLTTSLFIIPDEILGLLPFDALLKGTVKSPDNFKTYPFLFFDHAVSYCYSATLLHEMQQKQHEKQKLKSVLSMAPFYDGTKAQAERDLIQSMGQNLSSDSIYLTSRGKSFRKLPSSGQEAVYVSRLLNGDCLLGPDATLNFFWQEAANYHILHLSTHGVANTHIGNASYLVFGESATGSDQGLLYVRDLYNLELNADLVVLSACETSAGQRLRGEGIISLARAFAFAGAKSILTTLWVANDYVTKEILIRFFYEMKMGGDKQIAIHKAKKDFLDDHPGDKWHPFFWAGFIVAGDITNVKN